MRVLLMEINQESNSFCAVKNKLEHYRNCCLYEGKEILENIVGKQVAVGGMIQALQEDGVEVIPGLCMRANASGILKDEIYDFFIGKLREYAAAAGKVDGCYISLHGATQAETHEDVCGDVLEEVRRLLGNNVVVATSYDLHANITPRMFRLADIICGYHTYPHVDQYETGYRAAKFGNSMLRGEKFHMAYGLLPMIQPASGYTTTEGALHEVLQNMFAKVDNSLVQDMSAFQMQPWLDVSCGGSAVVAIGSDEGAVQAAVRQTMNEMWQIRHNMMPKTATVEDVIAAARRHEDGRPIVVADFSDSPNAGAAGDNFDIAYAIMRQAPELKVGTIINDPALADRAFAEGLGSTFQACVGGTLDPQFSRSYPGIFYVESLHTGRYVIEGPSMRFLHECIGPTATLHMGNIAFVVCHSMATTGDPQLLRHFGVEPTMYDVVIVKACTSFRAAYGKFAGQMMVIDTGCSATAQLTQLPFRHLPRDFYPFTDQEHPAQMDIVLTK